MQWREVHAVDEAVSGVVVTGVDVPSMRSGSVTSEAIAGCKKHRRLKQEGGMAAVKSMRNAGAVHHVWPRLKSPLLNPATR